MRQKFRQAANSRFSKWLLFTAILLIIIHVLILSYLFSGNGALGKIINQERVAPANLALVRFILSGQHTNIERLKKNVASLSKANFQLENNDVNLSISSKPKWITQYSYTNDINTVLKKMAGYQHGFGFSYKLKNGFWLNYAISPAFSVYQISLFLTLVEMIILAAVFIYMWSIARITLPLLDIKRAAEQLGFDLNTQLTQIKGPEIIEATASTLQQMQKRMRDLIEMRTNILAAISHDLRTPITRLKLRAQFINDQKISDKIVSDIDEMEAMIKGILSYAREDTLKETKKTFDLNALLNSICDDFTDLGNQIEYTGPKQRIIFNGRVIGIKRALNNVIGNACKHGSNIQATLALKNKTITITIIDDGPGIPRSAIKNVFKAFYRAPNQAISGTGLGLTIAQEVIQGHLGDISLKNQSAGGLKVVITLPTVRS